MFERGDVVWVEGHKFVVGVVLNLLIISTDNVVIPTRFIKPIYRNGRKVKV